MNCFSAIVLSILSALGAAALIRIIAGMVLLPIRPKDTALHLVISAGKDINSLQNTIFALNWIRKTGIIDFDIIINDCGMDEQNKTLAELISNSCNIPIASDFELIDCIALGDPE